MATDLYSELPTDDNGPLLPASALAIGAHPDDIEFGAGGTLARWAESGCKVSLLVITDGSKGTWDRSVTQAQLAAIRKREQESAAALLGAFRTIHLDHVDGELQYTMELRAELCQWIREIRPNVVISHDPWQRYQLHPDHRVTGLATVDAVVAARDHLFFPEQLLPAHRPQAILLWSADEPDHWEDVSTTLDTKIAALLCHSTQSPTTMGSAHENEERRQAFADRIRQWAAESGSAAGLGAAEAFKRISP